MRKILIATVVAFVIGLPDVACLADDHAVQSYAPSPTQLQAIPANGMQAASPADHASVIAPTVAQTATRKCYYVLDVLLCD